MQRLCRQCGARYDGKPGSTLCPECVAVNRKNVIRDRACRSCGAVFPGGPRAWYCPECRRERQKDAKRRASHGTARPIGSTDICTVCGGEYVVTGGRQKYCPTCAADAMRAADRKNALEWYAKNKNPEQLREQKRAGTAPIACVVCGREFRPKDASITCSAECSRELNRQHNKSYEYTHRAERNAAQRDRRAKKKEGDNK